MPRTELIARRTARSKTFDNGDGTFTLESGGPHAHHLKAGAWVDTDTAWHDSTSEYLTGEFPGVLKVNKGTQALSMLLPGETVPRTLAPLNRNRKAVPSYSGNTVTIPDLWTGVTLRLVLCPEGVAVHFVKTAHPCDNPAFTVAGWTFTDYYGASTYMGADRLPVTVPQTIANGMLTYDFSAVPAGTVVE